MFTESIAHRDQPTAVGTGIAQHQAGTVCLSSDPGPLGGSWCGVSPEVLNGSGRRAKV